MKRDERSRRPYVATTEQIWALHDLMREPYEAGLLLAAFAGLRLAEVCGLRVSDVDFMRGIVHPEVQRPADPLKTDMRSMAAIPIPNSLAMTLSAHIARFSSTWIMCDESAQQMGPWQMQREVRKARAKEKVYPMGSVPRSPALLRLTANQLQAGREGGAVAVTARVSQDDVGHVPHFGRIPMTALGPQSTMRSRPGAILRTFAD